MNIGKYHLDENGVYDGVFFSLAGKLPSRITPIENKKVGYLFSINEVAFGTAWVETSERTGNEYVEVKIDSPLLPAPFYGRLFREADGSFNLVWTRPKAEATAKKPTPKAEPNKTSEG